MMLNTDQHNPGVTKRMSLDDYIKNVRGTNGGNDFPREMLEDIYNTVQQKPMKVLDIVSKVDTEDLLNPEMANHKWDNVLKRM